MSSGDAAVTLLHSGDGALLTVAISGELDRLRSDRIAGPVHDALADTTAAVLCDLSGVDYLDSAGAHLLHGLARSLAMRSIPLATVAPAAATPRRTLEITGLAQPLSLHASTAAALRALGVVPAERP